MAAGPSVVLPLNVGRVATPAFEISFTGPKAHELKKWSQLACDGGIGQAYALADHIANDTTSLMFLQGKFALRDFAARSSSGQATP
jgi:hypothetical protein